MVRRRHVCGGNQEFALWQLDYGRSCENAILLPYIRNEEAHHTNDAHKMHALQQKTAYVNYTKRKKDNYLWPIRSERSPGKRLWIRDLVRWCSRCCVSSKASPVLWIVFWKFCLWGLWLRRRRFPHCRRFSKTSFGCARAIFDWSTWARWAKISASLSAPFLLETRCTRSNSSWSRSRQLWRRLFRSSIQHF